jgi:CRISPR-associated protein Cas1
MHDRILELAEGPVFLRIRNRLLEIRAGEGLLQTVPPEDLAALCDGQYLPAASMLPMQAHSTQANRYAAQVALSVPRKKRAWQAIVRCQISLRADLLQSLNGEDGGLRAMQSRVRSGDPDNAEAHAARAFWRSFQGAEFRRDRQAPDINRFLNYGYTVLRSLVARSICAVGLHPSFGIHHSNCYDAFCLAEDLCEPFRPVVEAIVHRAVGRDGDSTAMTAGVRAAILGIMSYRLPYANGVWTLPDATRRLASSLARIVEGQADQLDLPIALGDTGNGNC